MPFGPKRAPGRYEVPVSKGAPAMTMVSFTCDPQNFSVPRKAISYFSSSLARQGQYGKRPKVDIPEKTESAYECQ